MAKTAFTSVPDYIAAQPSPAQAVLRKVRGAIRKALPKAEETISYNIPAYKLAGRATLYFAAFKAHYSLYPASDALIAAIGNARGPHVIKSRTIRFPLDQPVPVALIARIAQLRAKEQTKQRLARAS
jgi:uncharacterized protein YdhG (YjbR/CyaY superfamily)